MGPYLRSASICLRSGKRKAVMPDYRHSKMRFPKRQTKERSGILDNPHDQKVTGKAQRCRDGVVDKAQSGANRDNEVPGESQWLNPRDKQQRVLKEVDKVMIKNFEELSLSERRQMILQYIDDLSKVVQDLEAVFGRCLGLTTSQRLHVPEKHETTTESTTQKPSSSEHDPSDHGTRAPMITDEGDPGDPSAGVASRGKLLHPKSGAQCPAESYIDAADRSQGGDHVSVDNDTSVPEGAMQAHQDILSSSRRDVMDVHKANAPLDCDSMDQVYREDDDQIGALSTQAAGASVLHNEQVSRVDDDQSFAPTKQRIGQNLEADVFQKRRRRKKRRKLFTHIKKHHVQFIPKRRAVRDGKVRTPRSDEVEMKDREPKVTKKPHVLVNEHDEEKTVYEPYDRTSDAKKQRIVDTDPDEDELAGYFQELAFFSDDGWGKPKPMMEEKMNSRDKEGCSHKYQLEDDVGWVCEQCGLVIQDIQSVFLPEILMSSKKQAPTQRAQEDIAESSSLEHSRKFLPLPTSGEKFPRLNLSLHPFYDEHLHPHQKEGFKFLAKNLVGESSSKLEPGGCILAHAPGTGKSLLTVSFIQCFLTAFPEGRPVIVAPKIMLKPWEKEFENWNVEDIPTYNLNECGKKGGRGTKDAMDTRLCGNLQSRRLKLIKKWLQTRSVLLVSYNLFHILILKGLEDESFGSIKQQICQALLEGPELLVLDEGHFPRTKRTKISQALMRVHTKRRVLLTGTLFQNNFKEIFNLLRLSRHNFMSFLPEFAAELKARELGKKNDDNLTVEEIDMSTRECEEQMFMEGIGCKLEDFVQGASYSEDMNRVLHKLRALTSPIVHWYAGQILENLPGLSEFVVYLNLTEDQQELYSHLKCKRGLEERTRIAEVCIHPALLKNDDSLAISGPQLHSEQEPLKGVKTAFVFHLLRRCMVCNEKLLIFCQTLGPLALIGSMLTKMMGWSRSIEFVCLDGTMQSEDRQQVIDQFNEGSSKTRVMLASITACKEGISLVGASRVVILDVLWNPSVVRQAVSRAFRLGQTRKVYVYRLVAANTKEEKIFQGAIQKDWLSRILMDQSFRMTSRGFNPANILRIDKTPCDKMLQNLVETDKCNRIDRICRYQTLSSSAADRSKWDYE